MGLYEGDSDWVALTRHLPQTHSRSSQTHQHTTNGLADVLIGAASDPVSYEINGRRSPRSPK
jgi:hypothetical protein